MINIKIVKVLDQAVLPTKAHAGDAAFDLSALERVSLKRVNNSNCWIAKYSTGLKMEIPHGFEGQIYPRSSSFKEPWFLGNCVGIIDSTYRGEVFIMLKTFLSDMGVPQDIFPDPTPENPQRIAQMMIREVLPVTFVEVDELTETERGEGGFGSTGK